MASSSVRAVVEKPVIVVVDDEPRELALLLEALQRRFGADYRIAPYLTPSSAIDDIRAMASGGEDVTLVIADQWMPEMSGRELLAKIRTVEPLAKRALLVPWGDRSASPEILQGCAYGQLDYYLTKPWAPAEVHLYPPISEFLAEWTRTYRPSLEIVKVVGDDPAPRSHEVRELLTRGGIPHGFYAATSAEGQRLLVERGLSPSRLPVVLLADGSVLVAPTNADLGDVLSDGTPDTLKADLTVVGGTDRRNASHLRSARGRSPSRTSTSTWARPPTRTLRLTSRQRGQTRATRPRAPSMHHNL